MIEIKDLLAKFDHILSSETVKIQAVSEVISKVINISLTINQIEIKNDTVYLDIKPIYKSEILLKKEKILSLLTESLGKKTPKEIR